MNVWFLAPNLDRQLESPRSKNGRTRKVETTRSEKRVVIPVADGSSSTLVGGIGAGTMFAVVGTGVVVEAPAGVVVLAEAATVVGSRLELPVLPLLLPAEVAAALSLTAVGLTMYTAVQ